MTQVTTIGLDLAKLVFQVHGADDEGRPVVRKKLRRGQVLEFFAGLCHVVEWKTNELGEEALVTLGP